jgi:hypothetical protein
VSTGRGGWGGTAAGSVDPDVPSPARMYDLWLGGKDNYASDRLAADKVSREIDDIDEACRDNRAFLVRAVRYLAGHGIDQFLDLGCGLPGEVNVHEIAQRVAPSAQVVYVDNDPIAGIHGHALLENRDTATVLAADFRDTEALLSHSAVTSAIDWSRPVGVLLLAALQHVTDSDGPRAVLRTLRARMAPGSYLVVSHLSGDGLPRPQVRAATKIFAGASAPTVFRSRMELNDLLDGFDQLPPGLDRPSQWWPDPDVPGPTTECMWAVAAQVPPEVEG